MAGGRGPLMTLLAGARVLVTGAGGFVGPHLVAALVARGARVRGAGIGAPRANGLAPAAGVTQGAAQRPHAQMKRRPRLRKRATAAASG